MNPQSLRSVDPVLFLIYIHGLAGGLLLTVKLGRVA